MVCSSPSVSVCCVIITKPNKRKKHLKVSFAMVFLSFAAWHLLSWYHPMLQHSGRPCLFLWVVLSHPGWFSYGLSGEATKNIPMTSHHWGPIHWRWPELCRGRRGHFFTFWSFEHGSLRGSLELAHTSDPLPGVPTTGVGHGNGEWRNIRWVNKYIHVNKYRHT